MDPLLHRDAQEHGLTRGQLRHEQWFHPVDGVAMLQTATHDLDSWCRAVSLVLPPDAVFTHLTSARLRGWWLPRLESIPVIACTGDEAPHHDRRGVYVRRCAIPPGHRHVLRGLPVASAEWTIVELSEHLGLLDLVAIIDCALHREETTIDRLRATMRPGRRGVRTLRRALDLADGRSESWWETMLRLIHTLGGISVEPQHIVRNRAGVIIARTDLRITGSNRVPEYDGADHRERQQHQDDLRREKALLRVGLERYGYTSPEILYGPERVIADAEDALGLPHLPARVEAWRREARASSLTPAGQRALERRLRRFVRLTTPRPSSGAK